MSKEYNLQRYKDACHQMQSGVKFDQESGSDDGNPKHLRVGINVALCDHTALIKLLLKKGIITEEEYFEAIRVEMELEVERYKQILRLKFGKEIELI